MWTPPALASEARAWAGDLWRVVESQSRVATLKLVDTLDEQAILEAELEGSKPLIPASCVHLDTLLATPFRYAPYRVAKPGGAGQSKGSFRPIPSTRGSPGLPRSVLLRWRGCPGRIRRA
jgi:hypothetical protein